MAAASAPLSPSALRQMQRALAMASDAQLVRITGMLDHLADRGEADALIAPLRSRLAELHPSRPLSFTRLLFLPLEPLLVEAAAYTHGSLGVPRTAITPIARRVRAALGEQGAQAAAAAETLCLSDCFRVRQWGGTVWPAAAKVLAADGAPPADWQEATGLNPGAWRAVARTAVTVLAEAAWLYTTLQAAASGLAPEVDELRIWLEEASRRHPEPPGALLATLLARLPEAVPLIEPSASDPSWCARQAEPAIDFLLGRIRVLAAAPPTVFQEIRLKSAAALLAALADPGPAQRPSRLRQVEGLRRQLDQACRRHFADTLARRVLAPLAEAALAGPPSLEEMEGIERTARALKRLQAIGGTLGASEAYDEALAAAVQQIAAAEGVGAVERARVVEILAGPAAALAFCRG